MKVIIVTGTPGTGKTTFAKKAAEEKGWEYIDVNSIIERKNLSEAYDEEKQCNIVDENKLAKELEEKIREKSSNKNLRGIIIDSHMSHCINPRHTNLCIVTRCDLSELKKRLEAKGYNEKKVKDNLQCEIMEVCSIEAKEAGHNVKEIDSTKEIKKEIIKDLLQ